MTDTQAATINDLEVNDYPSDKVLAVISGWEDYKNARGWFNFICRHWWRAGWCWSENKPNQIRISTGGWSGNEDIIGAMRKNHALWSQCWECTRNGGHYEFAVPWEYFKATGDGDEK